MDRVMVKIRAFIAIPLPGNILTEVRRVQESLKRVPHKFRWVRPENIHLTLKFLGDIDATATAVIFEAMRETAREFMPLSLSVRGLGVFPGVRRPRVLWAGLAGQTGRLIELQHTLETYLEDKGYDRDRKKSFKGHLTIARVKGRVDSAKFVETLETVGRFETDPFTADRFILYQSDLKPSGAVYTALKTARLESPPS